MSRFLAALVFACLMLIAVRSYGDDPHDVTAPECSNISPREIGSLILQAAQVAASACPEAPTCECPKIPTKFVLCRQSWNGKIVRCKRFALKPLLSE